MGAFDSEAGLELMVPSASLDLFPVPGSVTVIAMLSEPQPITIVLPADPMAFFTFARRAFHHPLEVTIDAFDGSVAADEREVGVVVSPNQVSTGGGLLGLDFGGENRVAQRSQSDERR
jgi:hypothetical protein